MDDAGSSRQADLTSLACEPSGAGARAGSGAGRNGTGRFRCERPEAGHRPRRKALPSHGQSQLNPDLRHVADHTCLRRGDPFRPSTSYRKDGKGEPEYEEISHGIHCFDNGLCCVELLTTRQMMEIQTKMAFNHQGKSYVIHLGMGTI